MKATKLVSIGIIVLVALTIVISMATNQLKFAHAAGATKSHQATTSHPSSSAAIPAALQVPEGNVFLFTLFGKGVLTFACPATAMSIESPMIILMNQLGAPSSGTHYAINNGLYWENLTGNSVLATPLVKIPSPINPNMNAPWVLLKAQAHIGIGQFNRVTFIQRVFTNGGLPVPGNCQNGQTEQSAPFTTQYLFYGLSSNNN
jgi:hypothetical protein